MYNSTPRQQKRTIQILMMVMALCFFFAGGSLLPNEISMGLGFIGIGFALAAPVLFY